MKYKYQKMESSSYISYNYDIRDIELGNIDMEDFWKRIEDSSHNSWVKSIAGNGHPLVVGFPISSQCPEFILACASNYDSASHLVRKQVGESIVKLDEGYFDQILKLPEFVEYVDLNLKTTQKA